jgi:hypothetical protein
VYLKVRIFGHFVCQQNPGISLPNNPAMIEDNEPIGGPQRFQLV